MQQEEDIEKITKEMEEKRNQIQALEMKLLTPGKHVEFPITKPSVCAVCKKSFLNEFFLQQHQTRKHEDDDKVVVKESIQVVITQHDTGRMMKIEKLLTSSMNMLYKDVAFSASLPMEMIRLLYNSKYIAQKDDSSILQLMGCTSATQVQNEVLRISLVSGKIIYIVSASTYGTICVASFGHTTKIDARNSCGRKSRRIGRATCAGKISC